MIDFLGRQKALQRDFKAVFNTEAGQRVLGWLADHNFVFQHTTVVGDSHLSAFNDGRRAVLLDIMRFLAVDEVALMKMYQERSHDGTDG